MIALMGSHASLQGLQFQEYHQHLGAAQLIAYYFPCILLNNFLSTSASNCFANFIRVLSNEASLITYCCICSRLNNFPSFKTSQTGTITKHEIFDFSIRMQILLIYN